MKKYTGTKEVLAQPMTASEAVSKGYKVNNYTGDGYEIEYKDGYKSWSPKEVFEEAYFLSETPLDRMHIEENDLDKKLIAIDNFIESDTFKKLDSIFQAMLKVQYRMMCDYQQILNNRIDKINLGTIVNGYLDFGQAIEFLKAGCAVRRLGWNEKCLFVIKQIPIHIDSTVIPNMQSLPQSDKDLIMDSIQSLVYTSQGIIIDTKTGKADSWSPSISDVFAEDWELITY
jgi:hypothetical protein